MIEFRNQRIKTILTRYQTVAALEGLVALAGWDLETNMPEAAASDRGFVFGKTLVLIQQLLLEPELKQLINEPDSADLNLHERAVLRVLRREIAQLEKIPQDFIEEFNRVTTEAQMVWRKAKKGNDFAAFVPPLERIVALVRRKADYLGYAVHPYDALIDIFEEGWTTADFDHYFTTLRDPLKHLLERIRRSPRYIDQLPLEAERYEQPAMVALNRAVLEQLGWDPTRMRLDTSAHPFEERITLRDVRITTWYQGQDFRRSLSAVIHEFGHALYELQSDEALAFTPLQGGVSYGLHESQSRFWENMVGRHPAFLESLYPKAKEHLPFLAKYNVNDFIHYFNFIRPDLIRVEADELTYHFHIMLRFEAEKRLVDGTLGVNELREFWNETMKSYLGVAPATDAEGVLQDIHWSGGSFGYFPTYSLGTVLSALWRERIEKELGSIDKLIKADGAMTLHTWLKEKIHGHGRTYTPKELITRVTGGEFSVQPFLNYLETKYSEIYKLNN